MRRRKKTKKICPVITGKVQMTREGFIFVIPDDGGDDVFVKAAKTRKALDGDTVKVTITKDATHGGRKEGEVIDIVKRSRKSFVGYFHMVGAQAWVLMQNRHMPYDISVDAEQALSAGAQMGMKVSVVVDRWDRKDPAPVGHIVDVLGKPGDNDTEMHAILAEYNLPYRFEPAVESAADSISEKITSDDLKGRKDFRDTLTFTIDPSDAKDFDDALSFKTLPDGTFEVGVHIADVSWYVKPGTPVDLEARNRGTSVYLVDRTVPMLPEKLCNKLCSLRPGEEKLTFSAVFTLSPSAKVISSWIGRTVIRSDHRFDYEGAQDIIEGKDSQVSEELRQAVLTLNDLASKLREKRFASGAINFNRPEMKVEVDEKGKPVNVYQKFSKEANWLIEEYMLLANRTVAEFVSRKNKTFVYRVHDEPDMIKMENLKTFCKSFGYKLQFKQEGKNVASILKELFTKADGKPEASAFEDIALRAMAKAVYSTDNIGHFGLAFKYYTHFTSPIRRYPDTMVHRLLAMYLDGAPGQDKNYYESECLYASSREQVAADAERSSVKYKLVEYMSDKIGEEFDGKISGFSERGMFVAVEPTKIEGMIPYREIHSDFFDFQEEKYRIVGRRTGKIYRLGDTVRVKVKNADVEQRFLDYELI